MKYLEIDSKIRFIKKIKNKYIINIVLILNIVELYVVYIYNLFFKLNYLRKFFLW